MSDFKTGPTRLGSGAQARGPALICLYGAGETGKTRAACAVNRACPDWFGPRSVYVATDPEGASLGSVLRPDKANMEVIMLDERKDIHVQLVELYSYDWRKEGFQTVITDTLTTAMQVLLTQLTNSGRFSDKNIDLGGGMKLPQQGDFLGSETLAFSLLNKMKQSGLNHVCVFHEQEVRPDAGKPGEPIGGPSTVGKAAVRKLVNWYNTVLHMTQEQKRRQDLSKPVEYERIMYTAGHGLWQAKLRTADLTNPIPRIIVDKDPVNAWRLIDSTIHAKETTTS